ncbi:hypothetical protein KIPB_013382, partial [Kipferlia bialata]|eukprot:g13382.t1
MGAGQSTKPKELSSKIAKDLASATHFSEDEINRFYNHFCELAAADVDDGRITFTEFLTALNLKDSLFAKRIFQLFDKDNNQNISFEELIHGMSVFSAAGTAAEKIDFSFRIYDLDGNGYID